MCPELDAGADLLPQTCICSVLCTLKPRILKKQAELLLGPSSACLEGV